MSAVSYLVNVFQVEEVLGNLRASLVRSAGMQWLIYYVSWSSLKRVPVRNVYRTRKLKIYSYSANLDLSNEMSRVAVQY